MTLFCVNISVLENDKYASFCIKLPTLIDMASGANGEPLPFTAEELSQFNGSWSLKSDMRVSINDSKDISLLKPDMKLILLLITASIVFEVTVGIDDGRFQQTYGSSSDLGSRG